MEANSLVLLSVDGMVATLTINRPDKLNALNSAVITELKRQLELLDADPAVRVVILTGSGGKAFVAGADIAEMSSLSPQDAQQFAREGQALGTVIDDLGKPVIAAIEGYALGGGCELALMCHLRVASPKAVFSQPEVGLGLIPGFGGTQRLSRLVGEGRAIEMITTCRRVDADTALAWGLVNRVARDQSALELARVLATEIAGQAPVAVGLSIDAIRTGSSMPLADALEYEAALFGLVCSSADMKEGTSAFSEKRKPRFEGR